MSTEAPPLSFDFAPPDDSPSTPSLPPPAADAGGAFSFTSTPPAPGGFGGEGAFAFHRPLTAEEAHAPAMARGAKCRECPLFGCGRGPVMGQIVPNAKLALVAEAPGPNEVLKKQTLVGWSDREVTEALAIGGLGRSEVTLTNTILCQPPLGGNFEEMEADLAHQHRRRMKAWEKAHAAWSRTAASALARGEAVAEEPKAPEPPVMPAAACQPRLARDLAESNSKVVLAVGKQALRGVAAEMGMAYDRKPDVAAGEAFVAPIKKQHGAPVVSPRDGRVLMAAYHPAMAARDKREWLPVIRENITRAARLAMRDGHVTIDEPRFYLNAPADQIVNIAEYFRTKGLEVTVDIETDSIGRYTCKVHCVGFGATLENGHEAVCVAPLLKKDQTEWWTPSDRERVERALRAMLDDPNVPLAGQNFQFDTGVLLHNGYMTNRTKGWSDVMLLHHDTEDNDLPHNLSFIARRYFDTPMWKNDVDFKNVEYPDDETLHLYNARDVLYTMRLLKPLRERVAQLGSQAQYQTDANLAPVIREMGELGMVIDENQRGRFSSMLNKKTKFHLERLREMTGIADLNPRSTPQLQELFYETWGHTPVLATDGYEWEEGDDGSTSSASLIELKKKIGEEHPQSRFIEELLEYRAFDKLRGTYTDNLEVRPVDWAAFGMQVGRADAVVEDVWREQKSALDGKKHWGFWSTEILPERGALSLLNTVYKAHIIPTGRLATEPAIQNWPVLGKANMRMMGVAPPGHVIVGADYEQIEARLYYAMSGDRFIGYAIQNGLDIHSLNAATLLAEREAEIMTWYEAINDKSPANADNRKYWRTVAKNFGFLEIYGGEEKTLFTTMAQKRNKEDGKLTFPNITPEIVDLWHERWHRLHPETRQWHALCHAQQRATGYACVPTLDGRKRWFPAGPSKKNAVPNMTIQGFASSIANRALLAIAEAIPIRGWSYWSGPFLQVHDYIGCYVPEHRAEEAADIIEKCMHYEFNGVSFDAIAEISYDWAEKKKIKRGGQKKTATFAFA